MSVARRYPMEDTEADSSKLTARSCKQGVVVAAKQEDVEAAGDQLVVDEKDTARPPSIYDLYHGRYITLAVVACASLLMPLSDTVYLPALQSLVADLQTTDGFAAASVAVYMAAVGALCLVWGPFSDRYGRRLTYFVCSAAFLATTLVCIFAPTIQLLVAFRALQGAAVTGYMVAGNGVIADIFPPQQRGLAGGLFMIPVLIGPIIGPLIGGCLAQAFGWRSTFVALAAFSAAAFLGLLLVLRKETHQYFTLERIKAQEGEAAAAKLQEAPSIQRPVFRPPWQPLRLLLEVQVGPYVLSNLICFASMFATVMVLPVQLAQPPYSLTPGMIGVAYLGLGFGGFLGSPLGGLLADASAAKFHTALQGRLLCGAVVAAVLMPVSLLVFGWTLQHTTHLAGVIIGHFCVGAALSAYAPAIFSYLTVSKQQQAAAVTAAMQAGMFLLSAVFILCSVPLMQAIGAGLLCSILAGLALLSFIVTVALVLRALSQPAQAQQLDR